MSHNPANTNVDRPKLTCHHCKEPGSYRNQCRLLKEQREQTENTQINPGNKNSDTKNSNPNNKNNKNHNNYKNSNRAEKKQETVYLCCETCGATNHSIERCYVRANAAKRPLPWKSKPEGQSGHPQQDAHKSLTGCVLATVQHLNQKCHIFTPEL